MMLLPCAVSGRVLKSARLILALAAVLALAACHRKTPAELLDDANALYQQKDVLSASMKYEDVLKRFPDSNEAAEARVGLAMCQLLDKDFEKAREQLELAKKAAGGVKTQDGFRIEMMRLGSFLQEKKPQKALDEALKTSSSLRDAPEEARDAFQMNMVELYSQNKRSDVASTICLSLLDKATTDTSTFMPILERLGMLRANAKDYAGAARAYGDFLARRPESSARGILLFSQAFYERQGGQDARATETLKLAEQQLTHDAEVALGADQKVAALQQLARVQEFAGRFDEARKTLERLLDRDKFPLAQHRLASQKSIADLEMMRNRPQAAIQELQQVVKENANSQTAASAGQMIQQIQARMQQARTSATLARDASSTATLGKAPAAPKAAENQPAGEASH